MIELTHQFERINWREPLLLLIGLLPFLIYLLNYILQKRQYRLYADEHLLPWVIVQSNKNIRSSVLHKIFSKNGAYILAWLSFSIAAAGPRVILEIPDNKLTTSPDIMLVVDISRSMQGTDIHPNRLRRVQIEIAELLERSHGNRIGIIVFAARPHLYVPLTSDYNALRFYLNSLDELVLPTMGSQPSLALKLAYDELTASQSKLIETLSIGSSVVLISDGDWHDFSNTETQRLTDLSTTLKQNNISVNVLGVATKEGSAIPLSYVFNETGWLKHKGQTIVSRMDETQLRQLAHITDGSYSPVSDNDSDWIAIYDNGVLQRYNPHLNPIIKDKIIWRELYSWFLAPAILFLWFSIIPYGVRSGLSSWVSCRIAKRQTLKITIIPTLLFLAATGILIFSPLQQANASEPENQAYRAYSNTNYKLALKHYQNITGYIGRLGEGASLYQLDKYKGAILQFTQAVLEANDDSNRATALYNLGNSYFKLGDYRSAVKVYKDALLYQPKHKATHHNLSFSESLLAAIEKRLTPTSGTDRTGSGSSSTRVDNGLSVVEQNSISIDDSQKTPSTTLSLPNLPDLSNSTIQSLLNKGFQYIKLAHERNENLNNSEKKRAILAQSNARIRITELEDRQALLWKRLFEKEEGFSAPQDQPSEIPGVAPW